MATVIISYAFAKIFQTQFVTQPSIYDRPVGSLNGFLLTWHYFGYSYWYSLVIAFTQIASSILLFFRRTTRAGVIIFLTFMVNILLTDFAYDIDAAKGMALTLTAMALFVLLSDFKFLWKYFVEEPPLFQDSDRPRWMNKASKIKFIYIPFVFIGLFVLITFLRDKYMGRNEFYGTWENVITLDRLHFEAGHTFQLMKQHEFESFASGAYTFTGDSIVLKSEVRKDSDTLEIYLQGAYTLTLEQLTIRSKDRDWEFKRIR